MQPAVLGPLPLLGREDVGQGVGEVVDDALGLARGAGGEVEDHGVRGQGGLAFQGVLCLFHGLGQVGKARHRLPDGPQAAISPCLGHGGSHPLGHVALGGADNGPHRGAGEPVGQVLLGEHVGHGNENGPELMQGHRHKPVFIVALERHHHIVSPADPCPAEHLGRLIAPALQVAKGKTRLAALPVAPDQRLLLGGLGRHHVHHIITKVKVLRVVQLKPGQPTLFVKGLPAEGFIKMHGSLPHSVMGAAGRPMARKRW